MSAAQGTELDALIKALEKPLKDLGYKKKRYVWYKDKGSLTVVFSVQRSQFGRELWYYNFGVGINALSDEAINTVSKCHITERLDMKIKGKALTPDVLAKAVSKWENEYGDIAALRARALENRLPAASSLRAVTYLTSVVL